MVAFAVERSISPQIPAAWRLKARQEVMAPVETARSERGGSSLGRP